VLLASCIAIFTKSAQFPFHEWLTDAMEGPTPVSAYLHSSTMVKAGVFAAILLFPPLPGNGMLPIILVFGIITAILSTFGALRELHIKKVIAYSTIQELSIMFIAIGSGALLAAVYFFFVQTFYKALLFFSAGNIMEATGSEYIPDFRA
jgi:NADH-quinone oxidoreductase subunit L